MDFGFRNSKMLILRYLFQHISRLLDLRGFVSFYSMKMSTGWSKIRWKWIEWENSIDGMWILQLIQNVVWILLLRLIILQINDCNICRLHQSKVLSQLLRFICCSCWNGDQNSWKNENRSISNAFYCFTISFKWFAIFPSWHM